MNAVLPTAASPCAAARLSTASCSTTSLSRGCWKLQSARGPASIPVQITAQWRLGGRKAKIELSQRKNPVKPETELGRPDDLAGEIYIDIPIDRKRYDE